MSERKRPDPKLAALRGCRTLNPRPDGVTDDLFHHAEFFDARDLLQVKYEMIRRVRIDEAAVADTAEAFGFSRPSFYQAQAAFTRDGLAGLLPRKRGPREAHKLSAEVMTFVQDLRAAERSLSAAAIVPRVKKQFGLDVHPRSIERALQRLEKKRR